MILETWKDIASSVQQLTHRWILNISIRLLILKCHLHLIRANQIYYLLKYDARLFENGPPKYSRTIISTKNTSNSSAKITATCGPRSRRVHVFLAFCAPLLFDLCSFRNVFSIDKKSAWRLFLNNCRECASLMLLQLSRPAFATLPKLLSLGVV